MTGLGIMVGGFIKGLKGKTIEKGDLVQSKTYQKHGKTISLLLAVITGEGLRLQKKIKIKELLLLKGSFRETLVREFMLTMMPSSTPNSNFGQNLQRLFMMMVKIMTIIHLWVMLWIESRVLNDGRM